MKTHLLPLFSWLLIFFTFTKPSLQEGKSLVTRLIHRDSILSPLHKNDYTISDRGKHIIESSDKRYLDLYARINSPFHPDDVEGSLIPNSGASIFFLNVSVGSPPVPQLFVLDTGSGFVWVQCARCPSCKKTKNPVYRPTKSTSFAPIPCDPIECQEVYSGKCDSSKYCEYYIKYGGGTYSRGTIATERFVFHSLLRGNFSASIVFGCGTKHNDAVSEANGVFGINGRNSSPIAALGNRFSYCLGNIHDTQYIHHFLIMGEEAVLDGRETAIFIKRGIPFVTIQAVAVNNKIIRADRFDFEQNVIFDTGSSISYLFESLLDPLVEEVKQILSNLGMRPHVIIKDRPKMLCYRGYAATDLPASSFLINVILPGFAMVWNSSEHLFFQYTNDIFCMAIDVPMHDFNVIGVIAQQYANIGYDFNENYMTYRDADCDSVARFLEHVN